jgi:threonine dehydrogenase-like Zn-dependent dehydrogenase
MVLEAPGRLSLQQFDRPRVGDADALLRLEACGICGSDVEQISGGLEALGMSPYPLIPGHEPVGRIEEIGPEAAESWGVSVGDRVAVEPLVACGRCRACLAGERSTCPRRQAYGFTSALTAPALWGGYAELMHLHPNSVLHKLPASLSPEVASWFNPLGAGIRWAVKAGPLRFGDTVVVMGAGQRGLACVIAARAAGAGQIIASDLRRAEHRLELARSLGADHVLYADEEDPVQRTREITGGRGADLVIEVAAVDPKPITDAVDLVRAGGTIVLAGAKGGKPIPGFVSDKMVLNSITMKGVFTVDSASYADAIRLIEADPEPFARLHDASFGLEQAAEAVARLAGTDGAPPALHVTIGGGAA